MVLGVLRRLTTRPGTGDNLGQWRCFPRWSSSNVRRNKTREQGTHGGANLGIHPGRQHDGGDVDVFETLNESTNDGFMNPGLEYTR
ncbi:unnamed protein product [Cuscuta campestris]|uniref:Uncharacterized protein n=1 Tax=Cuscuta campestris TaxID=132261 RepID=A0A484K8L8_9ASTE|nr:unnamed protein product [Cuscuta campestris]